MTRRTACFLSPHLDDAVFSAGGTIARLLDDGWRCRVVTVFTRSVPGPTGFALACQTDKGLAADVDYMALRRAEDAAACRTLGVPAEDIVHLDLPEAPHRGYTSAADLFAGMHDDDRPTTVAVAGAVRPFVDADRVYLPLGLGDHVDHLHVIAAAEELGVGTHRWQDTPYANRCPPGTLTQGQPVDIAATLGRKLDACAAYVTQLPFQFGGEPAMREVLTRQARATAGGDGLAERFHARREAPAGG